MVNSLVKCCNAVAERHGSALRVSFSASRSALCLLVREAAITCEACLALNAEKLTACAYIILKEY